MAGIEEVNRKELETEILVASADVEALYPSIDVDLAASIVKAKIMESPLKLEGVDWRWILIYIKLMLGPGEIVDNKLQGILPRRVVNKNKPPTIKTVELDQFKERWWYPTKVDKLTEEQKRLLIGCVLEQLTKLVFRTHYYEWEGTLYRQKFGGPIGLRASGPIGRILMDFWANKILKQVRNVVIKVS